MKNIDQLEIFYAEYEALSNTKNRSKATLETYKSVLKYLNNWETVDELLEQINYHLTQNVENLSQNTLFLRRAVFKVFCEWFSKRNQIYIPFNQRIIKFKIERGTRQAYSKDELNILIKELKEFNNPKFELIFKILILTGIRVSEWDNINWRELKNKNFKMFINTAKNNNPRIFYIPEDDAYVDDWLKNLRTQVINNLNSLYISSKTIKNMFWEFKEFVMSKHPDFTGKISAHILRHYFATNSNKNLDGNVELVSKLMGHLNSNTTASTYINYDIETATEYMIMAQMPNEKALQLKEVRTELKFYKDENARLSKENEYLRSLLKRYNLLPNDVNDDRVIYDN